MQEKMKTMAAYEEANTRVEIHRVDGGYVVKTIVPGEAEARESKVIEEFAQAREEAVRTKTRLALELMGYGKKAQKAEGVRVAIEEPWHKTYSSFKHRLYGALQELRQEVA